MKKEVTLDELRERKDEWTRAVIVFTEDSFNKHYDELSRSYEVSSSDNFFNDKISNSLWGDCLDGKDDGTRLDWYMYSLPEDNLGKRWKIEKCYIVE